MGKEGKLNYKEFAEMDKFVQRIKQQVEKETEDKEKHHQDAHHSATSDVASIISKLFGRSNSHSEGLDTHESHHRSIDSQHSLSSLASGSVSPTSAEKFSVKFFSSPAKSPTSASCKRVHDTMSDLVKDRVTFELLPALHKEMFCKEGRKRFLDWLFKLVCFIACYLSC